MSALDREGFETGSADYDRAVAGDPEIDHFCSSSSWILSHLDAFHAGAEVVAARAGSDFAALAAVLEPRIGLLLQPLESMWGFASALVGNGSAEVLRELLGVARERFGRTPVLLTGLSPVGARLEPVLRVLAADYALRPLAATVRYQASLDGGFDGWLARRSAGFRRNLRAASSRVRAAGVRFECASPRTPAETSTLYARALAIEQHSWKSRSGNGVERGPMREFYASMLPRLASRGALRMLFARGGDADLGYLYGGVEGTTFRGLQFSYREDASDLGLGNALQAEMLTRLCAEGTERYDLGSQSEYKRRWAEPGLVSVGLLAVPRFGSQRR